MKSSGLQPLRANPDIIQGGLGRIMMPPRIFKVLGIAFSTAIVVLAIAYLYVVRERLEAKAFLKALSEVRTGITTREEYENKMKRFRGSGSSGATACYENGCLSGDGYTFENSVIGRLHLFPETILAVGVYFDSSNILQARVVTLDRYGMATATLEQLPPGASKATGEGALPRVHIRSGLIHKILDNSRPEELNDLAVSCFTSWYGCDTAEDLLVNRK
jgi:hypothetical protein